MAAVEPAVYTLEEAAVRLNMSKRALLPYVQAGFCGAFRLGPNGSWKIPRKKLDQFIENGGAAALNKCPDKPKGAER